ncbi:hypothetical protein [Amycolatopsis silviterrae]|uniref:PH domain-containing protein n=1 Tax=Amycolatopsis silviterrae TaxID=1656914 RepID=A0ABW5HBT5_9PSEU
MAALPRLPLLPHGRDPALAAAALAASFDLSYGGLLGWIVVLGLLVGTAVERRGFVAGTSYLVTDRRLVFVSPRPPGTEFRWAQLAGLRPPRVRDHGDGDGTIDFRPTATKRRATGRGRPGPRSCQS